MTDVLIGVIVMLTAYAVGVTCLAYYAWQQWGIEQVEHAEQRSLFNSYLRADAMSRHPAGKALFPPEVEPRILDALNKAAENPGTVVYGTWPEDTA